ncbi:MAG: hypothetical protein JWN86_1650 [Planctomycetota bacterium]|nr:hypothetical protein [Planctomycetota bacterium]
MNERLFGVLLVMGNIVTPVVGATCGMIAQARYKARLRALPEKVAQQMPRRFPMADLLLCLFMLGPIFGVAAIAISTPLIRFAPSTVDVASWWVMLTILLAINSSGPYLIQIGMPPDGSFGLEKTPGQAPVIGKPVVKHAPLFDAREI